MSDHIKHIYLNWIFSYMLSQLSPLQHNWWTTSHFNNKWRDKHTNSPYKSSKADGSKRNFLLSCTCFELTKNMCQSWGCQDVTPISDPLNWHLKLIVMMISAILLMVAPFLVKSCGLYAWKWYLLLSDTYP